MSLRRIRWDRARIFLKAQVLFLLPLALYMLPLEGPFVLVKIALLVPCIVLITLPAILFSTVGVALYEFQEFGAIPENEAAWVLIFLFWSLIAFLWSLRQVRRADLETADQPGGFPR